MQDTVSQENVDTQQHNSDPDDVGFEDEAFGPGENDDDDALDEIFGDIDDEPPESPDTEHGTNI